MSLAELGLAIAVAIIVACVWFFARHHLKRVRAVEEGLESAVAKLEPGQVFSYLEMPGFERAPGIYTQAINRLIRKRIVEHHDWGVFSKPC